jgi:hypothetical protein
MNQVKIIFIDFSIIKDCFLLVFVFSDVLLWILKRASTSLVRSIRFLHGMVRFLHGTVLAWYGMLSARYGMLLAQYGTLCAQYGSFLARYGSFLEWYALLKLDARYVNEEGVACTLHLFQ